MNISFYSSFIYLIVGIVSFFCRGKEDLYTYISFCLFITSLFEHYKPYIIRDKIDIIKITDIIFCFIFIFLSVYNFYDWYITYIALGYVIISYMFIKLVLINYENCDFYGCIIHSSFHLVSGISIIYVMLNS